MRRAVAVLFALALLTLGFLAGTWWNSRAPAGALPGDAAERASPRGGTTFVPSAPRSRGAATGETGPAREVAPAPEPSAKQPDAEEQGPTRVVRVLLPDGSRAAGARVTLERPAQPFMHRTGAPNWTKPAGVWSTGATGDVAVPSAELMAASRIVVEWQGTHVGSRPVPPSGFHAAENPPIEVRLRPSWTLRGRVESVDGDPIAGARCTLDWPSGNDGSRDDDRVETAGAEGQFEFAPAAVLEGEQYGFLEVTAPGFVKASQYFSASQVPENALTVRLERGIKVRGRCVDEQGRPVGAVPVRRGYDDAAKSDGAGRFEVDGVAVRGARIVVVPEELAPVILPAIDGSRGDVDVGDVVLRRGESIRGVFVDAQGAPLANANVSLTPSGDDQHAWTRNASTEADGTFAFDALASGEYDVQGTEPGAFAQARAAAATRVGSGVTDLRLAIPAGRSVRFQLLLASDRSQVTASKVDVKIVRGEGQRISGRGWQTSSGGLARVVYPFDVVGRFSAEVVVPGFEKVLVDDFEVTQDHETSVDVLLAPKAE